VDTIMGAGGWKSVSSMIVYTKNDEANARRGYDEAMRRIYARANLSTTKRVLSPEEFLAQYDTEN
jgi:hypothetical protein